MAEKKLEMIVVRCGNKGNVVLSNTFPRKTDPETGKRMEISVCKDGVLLREDGVQIRRSDGKPSKKPRINPEIATVSNGEDLRDFHRRNNIPKSFEWKYSEVGYYCG